MNIDTFNQEVITTILSRHSIRGFTQEAVSESALNTLLACAFAAPSARNTQPWFISVTQNRALIDEMSTIIVREALNQPMYAKMLEGKENYHAFYHAPLFLLLSGVTEDRSLHLNTGILLENILLTAEAVGLGACPIGFTRFLFEGNYAEQYKKRLQVPDTHTPIIGIVVGKVAPDFERKPAHSVNWQENHNDKVVFIS